MLRVIGKHNQNKFRKKNYYKTLLQLLIIKGIVMNNNQYVDVVVQILFRMLIVIKKSVNKIQNKTLLIIIIINKNQYLDVVLLIMFRMIIVNHNKKHLQEEELLRILLQLLMVIITIIMNNSLHENVVKMILQLMIMLILNKIKVKPLLRMIHIVTHNILIE